MKRIPIHLKYLNKGAFTSACAPYDSCCDMTDSDLRNYCRFLFSQVELKDKQYQDILCELSSIRGELKSSRLEDACEVSVSLIRLLS